MRKNSTNDLVFQQAFCEIRERYPDHISFYTDGSKDQGRVGAAAVSRGISLASRLPDEASIFTAEAKAILLALEQIGISSKRQFIIFSDSLSCLQSIQNQKADHPTIRQILEIHNDLCNQNLSIVYCWLPSHVGIAGNTSADKAAKRALELSITPLELPYHDLKPLIRIYINSICQSRWDRQENNKLHSLKPAFISTVRSGLSRHDAVVIRRCRIGHSHLTHSHILKAEDAPFCIPCDSPLTIEHILLQCADTMLTRINFYEATNYSIKSLTAR